MSKPALEENLLKTNYTQRVTAVKADNGRVGFFGKKSILNSKHVRTFLMGEALRVQKQTYTYTL